MTLPSEFPGGKIEPGETAEQCVVREVAEEVGMDVRPTALFPLIEYATADTFLRIQPFLCTPVSGHPRPLASQSLLWVPTDRLAEYPFPPANARLIGQIIVRLSSCDIPEFCEV